MSIPFISNTALTEVDSSGNLNDKAGATKSKFPIQIFRLTDNVTGNLTLDNNTAHKKIIFDTNGKTVINDAGSPLTINSSVPVELKGTGNIQSTLKSFSSSVTDASHTGTTTISEANNSTVVVSTFNKNADISLTAGVGVASGSNGFRGPFSTSRNIYLPNSELVDQPSNTTYNQGFMTASAKNAAKQMFNIVGAGYANVGTHSSPASGFSITMFNSLFFSTPQTFTGPTVTVTSDTNIRRFVLGTTTNGYGTFTVGVDFSTYQVSTNSEGEAVFGTNLQTITDLGQAGSDGTASTITNIRIPNAVVSAGGRNIAFTNNLTIPVCVTGDDPFNNVTVASSATNTIQISSTDGSFSLEATVSGSDSSFTPARPYALKLVNDGSGNIVIGTPYSGTLSTRAF